jgi:hypothetical protein
MKSGGTRFFAVGMLASLGFGWWVFPTLLYTPQQQPVQFSHALHVSDKVGLSCQDCHGFAKNGAFSGIPRLEQCASCHAEVSGTTEEEHRFVEEYVKQNREVQWRVYARQPDNAYFSHVYHVKTAGIECARCHGQHGETTTLRPLMVNVINGYSRDISGGSISGIRWQKPDGLKMSDCIACHKEHSHRSACIDCHK